MAISVTAVRRRGATVIIRFDDSIEMEFGSAADARAYLNREDPEKDRRAAVKVVEGSI